MNSYLTKQKNMTYTIKRNGVIIAEEIEANSPDEAIDKATSDWCYEVFGQGGALTPKQVSQESYFFNADFTAELT
jgi:hypothetical protein